MVIKNISLLGALALSGCAVFEPLAEKNDLNEVSPLASSVNFQRQYSRNFQQKDSHRTVAEPKETLLQKNSSKSTTSYKEQDINYYVRGMMQDLVANLQYVNAKTPVAVASFVMLDSDYNDANILGIQIAESLIHEVHKFGIPVIDFKTTGFIRVTEQGDFAFSKDYEDFSGEMPARYIVSGTMLKHTDGYLINARIIGVKSQAVVASAQSFIPNSVSDPILRMASVTKSSNDNQTVRLEIKAIPQDSNFAMSSQNTSVNQSNTKQISQMEQIINNSTSSNRVSLIQE